jgi:hypothetical protein
VRGVAKSHGVHYRGGKLALTCSHELFPLVGANKGEGIRRLNENHGLDVAMYIGAVVSDTDAFRMHSGMRA